MDVDLSIVKISINNNSSKQSDLLKKFCILQSNLQDFVEWLQTIKILLDLRTYEFWMDELRSTTADIPEFQSWLKLAKPTPMNSFLPVDKSNSRSQLNSAYRENIKEKASGTKKKIHLKSAQRKFVLILDINSNP